jgi:hypothetical protein
LRMQRCVLLRLLQLWVDDLGAMYIKVQRSEGLL